MCLLAKKKKVAAKHQNSSFYPTERSISHHSHSVCLATKTGKYRQAGFTCVNPLNSFSFAEQESNGKYNLKEGRVYYLNLQYKIFAPFSLSKSYVTFADNCTLSVGIMDIDPRQYENITINESDVHNIVLSYLVHNCFKDTVESFIASTGLKQTPDHLEDMEKRKRIFHFALEGNALKAIELTEELAPELLEQNKDLHFDLLSLHFVKLVRSRNCTEALEFAQSNLTPFGKVQKYVEKLEDFMALLAYEEPEKSPMFHLLSHEHRQHVADSLNRAILAHANLPGYSSLERLVQQTTVVRQRYSQETGKDLHPPFSLKDFLKS